MFCHRRGTSATFVTYGTVINNVIAAAEQLAKTGIEVSVLRLLSVTDLDGAELARQLTGEHVIVVEEMTAGSGIKETVGWALAEYAPQCHVHGVDLGSDFVPHGDLPTLYRRAGMDADSLANLVREVL